MRKTKIICTIGPASQSPEKIREMIEAGMNVCRCNFSHGSYEEQKNKMMTVVRISEEMKKPVATLIDTKGPEIRPLICYHYIYSGKWTDCRKCYFIKF